MGSITSYYADYLKETGSVGLIPPEYLSTVIIVIIVSLLFGLFVGYLIGHKSK